MLAAPFVGDDALAFVISHNLHRRHLSESQRAMIAKRVANMPRGYRSDIEHNANLHKVTSRAEAASLLNVSERSVATARKVQETAPPENMEHGGNRQDANLHLEPPVTRADAARLLNASEQICQLAE